MINKITPGDWHHTVATPDETESIVVKNNLECVMADGVVVALCGRYGEPQSQANARLISLAPEMLECLKSVMNMMITHDVIADGHGVTHFETLPQYHEVLDILSKINDE